MRLLPKAKSPQDCTEQRWALSPRVQVFNVLAGLCAQPRPLRKQLPVERVSHGGDGCSLVGAMLRDGANEIAIGGVRHGRWMFGEDSRGDDFRLNPRTLESLFVGEDREKKRAFHGPSLSALK